MYKYVDPFEAYKSTRPYQGQKCSVVMPCRDRLDHLQISLPRWLEQTYKNFDIVLVDYGSEEPIYPAVKRIAREYNCDIALNPDSEWKRLSNYQKITIFRLEDMKEFSMSHACNYGIRNSVSDTIQVCGCDTIPVPFYLELAIQSIDDNTFSMRQIGRMCFPKKFWWRINGYQEFCEGWGAEDADFCVRMLQNSSCVGIKAEYIASINHAEERRTNAYKTQDKHESNINNHDKCQEYFHKYGPIGNYNVIPGNEKPLQIKDNNMGYIHYSMSKESETFQVISTRSSIADSFVANGIRYNAAYVAGVEQNLDPKSILSPELPEPHSTIEIKNPSVNSILLNLRSIVIEHANQNTQNIKY